MHSIICRAVIGHSRHNSCIYTKHLTLNVNKLCCRASAHMPLSSTESLHYHYITGFFRDQMLWENHIQFQFQRYSWSSSIIIFHLRCVAKKISGRPPLGLPQRRSKISNCMENICRRRELPLGISWTSVATNSNFHPNMNIIH